MGGDPHGESWDCLGGGGSARGELGLHGGGSARGELGLHGEKGTAWGEGETAWSQGVLNPDLG